MQLYVAILAVWLANFYSMLKLRQNAAPRRTRLGCVINIDTTLKSGKKPYTARLGSDAKKWGRDGQARRRLFCGDEAVAHITI
jgi:hypothetical protein